jgi:hypothetical protein
MGGEVSVAELSKHQINIEKLLIVKNWRMT